jgi:hypothetical protein
MKWRGLLNGALVARASEEFDVFITVDRSLRHQQNRKKFSVAVVLLMAPNNDYEELQHFATKILTTLETIHKGELVILTS